MKEKGIAIAAGWVLIRCDLLDKFGVVGFLPLLPLHGWFAVLDRVAFLPTPGLRELKSCVSGVQKAMFC